MDSPLELYPGSINDERALSLVPKTMAKAQLTVLRVFTGITEASTAHMLNRVGWVLCQEDPHHRKEAQLCKDEHDRITPSTIKTDLEETFTP